jgi:predicted dehydrogenase
MSNLLAWRDDPHRKAYSFHRRLGGGVLMDFVHEPDYVYSIFGLPNEVKIFQGRLHRDFTVDSDDTCSMIWSYDKAYITFSLSYCSKEYVRKYDVLCEDGSNVTVQITKDDIEKSYTKQWEDLLQNGSKNSYTDCLQLYGKLLEG